MRRFATIYNLECSYPIDLGDEIPQARTFRQVLEAVQNGVEELGNATKPSDYDYKSPDAVDMSVAKNPVLFVEKQEIGMEMNSSFEDRLSDRLGLAPAEQTAEQTD